MHYFKQTLEEIQTASSLAYRLSRPGFLEESNTTQFVFGWRKHPELDEYIAVIGEDDDVPIHPLIKEGLLNNDESILDSFELIYISQDCKENAIDLCKTQDRVRIIDIIPCNWAEVDYETLENEGFFNQDLTIA